MQQFTNNNVSPSLSYVSYFLFCFQLLSLYIFQMEHPHLSLLQREKFIWSLSNVTLLETYMSVLDGDPLQEVVKSVIHQYKTCVIPKRFAFRKCKHIGSLHSLKIC